MLDHPLISHTDVQKLSEIQHSDTPLLVVLSFVQDEGALAFEELLTSVISASCVLLAGECLGYPPWIFLYLPFNYELESFQTISSRDMKNLIHGNKVHPCS
jgi:hypothetical protein